MQPNSGTQQPLYRFIRFGFLLPFDCRRFLCEWLFIPVRVAPFDIGSRKADEAFMIRSVGVLNPPKVHALGRFVSSNSRRRRMDARLTKQNRRLPRLRPSFSRAPAGNQPASSARHLHLQSVASALCAHRVLNAGHLSLSAWRLTPGPWTYVLNRFAFYEDGWRRARGLRIMRMIATKRRDLIFPIFRIQLSLPWTAPMQDPTCLDVRRFL